MGRSLMRLLLKLKATFHRNRDRQLDDELQLHLELLEEERITAGMSPQEARAAAQRQFGNKTRIQERSREIFSFLWMDDLVRDIRVALRSLKRTPWHTASALLTMALGIGAVGLAFSLVNGVFLTPLPYDEPERLVRLNRNEPNVFSLPTLLDYERQIEGLIPAGHYPRRASVLTDGPPESLEFTEVTSRYFEVLRVRPALGLLPTEERLSDGAKPVAISHGYWQTRWGGAADVIGSLIELEGQPAMRVVGVLPESFRNVIDAGLPAPIWTLADRAAHERRFQRLFQGIGRIQSQATLESANAEASAVQARLAAEYPNEEGSYTSVRLELLTDTILGDYRLAMQVFIAAVAAVLLIGVLNVANLQASKISQRGQEFSVRAALGASRWQLLRQMTVEALILTTLGGGLGFVFVYSVREALLAATPARLLPRLPDVAVDGRVLVFAAAVMFAAGLAIGLTTALRASRPDLIRSLKGGAGATDGRSQRRLQSVYTFAESALATVLLVGAGLLLHNFHELISVDPGFDARDVVSARVELPRRYADASLRESFVRLVLQRAGAQQGIEAAAATNAFPLELSVSMNLIADSGNTASAMRQEVSEEYAAVLRIPLYFGRWITQEEVERREPVAVVSVSAAQRLWPGENPIGKTLGRSVQYRIVGVAADFRGSAFQPQSIAYAPYGSGFVDMDPGGRGGVAVTFQARTHRSQWESLKAIITAAEPDSVATLRSMDEVVGQRFEREQFRAFVLAAFAGIALALALLGVYSVVAFATARRTREIGLRMALGASRSNVVVQMMRQGAMPALGGLAAGIGVAHFLTRFIASYLNGIEATASWAYMAALVAGLVLILAASWLPARRAARIDPMTALRYE